MLGRVQIPIPGLARSEQGQLGRGRGELRAVHGAIMGQTMRHSMPIYAHAHADAGMIKRHPSPYIVGLGCLFLFLLQHNRCMKQ